MKYMLTLFNEETGWDDATPEQMREGMRAWDAYTADAREAGVFVAGEGLAPSRTAMTVRLGGESLTTDGPFAETKEQLGGFYLLDVEDEEAALEWARRVPMQRGAVEVRAVIDYEIAGSDQHTVDGSPAS